MIGATVVTMRAMSLEVTISARIARLIVAVGRQRGVEDPERVLADAGLERDVLGTPDARITLAEEDAAWQAMAEAADDPWGFGLRAWPHVPRGAIGVLEYAMRASADVGEALRQMSRYNRLVHDVAELTLTIEGPLARIEHHFRGHARGASWHAADFTLASIVGWMRDATDGALGHIQARRVALQHGAPPDPDALDAYREVFGVTPTFDQPCNRLELDARLLALPLREADPELHAIIERQARTMLEALPSPLDDLVGRVRQLLAEAFESGTDASLDAVAGKLHMSARTLQRRLRASDTSHRALHDQLRQELAVQMLTERGLSVGEVAWRLGYSEPSAFHRAFKRWTGKTPAGIR